MGIGTMINEAIQRRLDLSTAPATVQAEAPAKAAALPIEDQIDALQARWTQEAKAKQRAQEDKEIARMTRLRNEMLAGTWKPFCQCRFCTRAVLELRQDRCEEYGRRKYYMGA